MLHANSLLRRPGAPWIRTTSSRSRTGASSRTSTNPALRAAYQASRFMRSPVTGFTCTASAIRPTPRALRRSGRRAPINRPFDEIVLDRAGRSGSTRK